jgi:ATP-dependent Clp protease ATP-binding subunit ClpC
MTSNLGTEFVRKGGTLGFLQRTESDEDRQAHDKIEKALKSTFRPEFLNRIDEIIMFSPLTLDNMHFIVDLQMKEVQGRMKEHGLVVNLTPAARDWLAGEGFDSAYGARPLKRAIQKHVESPLSIHLLKGEFEQGEVVYVDVAEDQKGLVFLREKEKEEADKKAASAAKEKSKEKTKSLTVTREEINPPAAVESETMGEKESEN